MACALRFVYRLLNIGMTRVCGVHVVCVSSVGVLRFVSIAVCCMRGVWDILLYMVCVVCTSCV